jgi:4'-phosphopantetheinyl transferase
MMFDIPLISFNESNTHVFSTYIPSKHHDLEGLWEILSNQEKNQAKQFVNDYLKNNYIISHGILRQILSIYSKVKPHAIQYSLNEFGKPFLNNDMRRLQFNMSHSRDYAVFIVTLDYLVGIDIEWKDETVNIEETAELILSPSEFFIFNKFNAKKKIQVFYDIWTKKEAIIKTIGLGFSYPIQTIDVLNDNSNEKIRHLFHKNVFYYPAFLNLKGYSGAIASTRKLDHVIQINI